MFSAGLVKIVKIKLKLTTLSGNMKVGWGVTREHPHAHGGGIYVLRILLALDTGWLRQ